MYPKILEEFLAEGKTRKDGGRKGAEGKYLFIHPYMCKHRKVTEQNCANLYKSSRINTQQT